MKLALPTNDGVTLAEHFGRSAGFIVFEVEEGRILSRESRANLPHAAHAHESCQGESDNHASHHSGMAAVLHDCSLVLCGGMGWRAAEALKQAGITAVMVAGTGPADEIVSRYVAGTISTSEGGFCRCHH